MSSLTNHHPLLRLNLKLNLDLKRNVKNQLLQLSNQRRDPKSMRKLLPRARRKRRETSRWRNPLNQLKPQQDLRRHQSRVRWRLSLISGLCPLPYPSREQKSSQKSKMIRCRNDILLVSHSSYYSIYLLIVISSFPIPHSMYRIISMTASVRCPDLQLHG